MRLKDKIAIITGASRGIGRAVAYKYAIEGSKVVAVARDGALLDSLLAEISKEAGRATKILADITREEECQRIIETTMSLYGRIDILVNNAGFLGSRNDITSTNAEEWRRVFETNTNSTFILSKLAAIKMKERKSGSIINLTSGVVRNPQPKWGAYLPSKFAVEGLTLMLAQELRGDGIRVNMVDPGRTNTDMIVKAFPEIPRNNFKSPDDVVEAFVFLASDESRLVTGTRISVI